MNVYTQACLGDCAIYGRCVHVCILLLHSCNFSRGRDHIFDDSLFPYSTRAQLWPVLSLIRASHQWRKKGSEPSLVSVCSVQDLQSLTIMINC